MGEEVRRVSLTHMLKIGVIASAAWLLAGEQGRAATYQCGSAAWFDLTGTTASGERADSSKMTAAHRSFPFNTRVKVENLNNGRAVIVRINDRGPYTKGRVIDVSKAAAQQLGFIRAGTTRVRISVVGGKKVRLDRSCSMRERRAKPGRIVEAAVTPPPPAKTSEPVPVPKPRLEATAYAPVEAGGDLPEADRFPADEILTDPAPSAAAEPDGDADLADRFADTFAAAAANPKMTVQSVDAANPIVEPPPVADTETGGQTIVQRSEPLPVEGQPEPVATEPEPVAAALDNPESAELIEPPADVAVIDPPAPAELIEPQADAILAKPASPGPQHGMAKRESWDRMQQVPN